MGAIVEVLFGPISPMESLAAGSSARVTDALVEFCRKSLYFPRN
jgi:hypothetical protein